MHDAIQPRYGGARDVVASQRAGFFWVLSTTGVSTGRLGWVHLLCCFALYSRVETELGLETGNAQGALITVPRQSMALAQVYKVCLRCHLKLLSSRPLLDAFYGATPTFTTSNLALLRTRIPVFSSQYVPIGVISFFSTWYKVSSRYRTEQEIPRSPTTCTRAGLLLLLLSVRDSAGQQHCRSGTMPGPAPIELYFTSSQSCWSFNMTSQDESHCAVCCLATQPSSASVLLSRMVRTTCSYPTAVVSTHVHTIRTSSSTSTSVQAAICTY